MRFAIFVAIVAAHIALIWYFLTLWHLARPEEDDQSSMTLVFLTPPELTPRPESPSAPENSNAGDERQRAWRAPLLYRNEQGSLQQAASVPHPTLQAESPQPTGQSENAESPTEAVEATEASARANVDWRDDAAIVAEADAQHIVESEDRAARQAGALAAMIKPLAGTRVRGPSFHWDPNPRYRWQRAAGGGFVIPLNDHCEIFVLIFVWAGCSIGELPPAHGDLFKNMHPPVKFGDWDWRLDDP